MGNFYLIYKNSDNTLAQQIEIEGKLFFFKRFCPSHSKLHRKFKNLFFPSRGYVNLIISEYLLNHGIPTPKIFAVGEKRNSYGNLISGYLISEQIKVRSYDIFLASHLKGEGIEELIPPLQQLASYLIGVHEINCFHGDSKLENLYLIDGKIGAWDLDSALIFSGGIPEKLRNKDIGRVISSFIALTDPLIKDGVKVRIEDINKIFCKAYGVSPSEIARALIGYWLRNTPLKHYY